MKKIICLILALVLISCSAYAFESDVRIYKTDIRAFVDSRLINSFNINGWTGIVAEDLSAFGFTVIWDAQRRTLEVGDRDFLYPGQVSYPKLNEYKVYKTDIKTYVCGEEVTAFNIGGYTVIFIDELMRYGDVIWDPDARTISFTYKEPWYAKLTPQSHVQDNACNGELGEIDAQFSRNADGTFDANGVGLNHLSWVSLSNDKKLGGMRLGFGMVAAHLIPDESFVTFLRGLVNTNYDGSQIKNDTQIVNSRAVVTINGQRVAVTNVAVEKGNNHLDYYFTLDCDMNKEEIESVTFKLKP